jgi:hypothetical protein
MGGNHRAHHIGQPKMTNNFAVSAAGNSQTIRAMSHPARMARREIGAKSAIMVSRPISRSVACWIWLEDKSIGGYPPRLPEDDQESSPAYGCQLFRPSGDRPFGLGSDLKRLEIFFAVDLDFSRPTLAAPAAAIGFPSFERAVGSGRSFAIGQVMRRPSDSLPP